MMERDYFTEEHKMFRDAFQKFVAREVVPYHEQWEKEGMVSRELWLKAGEMGFLGTDIPETYGGGGIEDYRYNSIINEELCAVNASGVGFVLHNDVVLPYLMAYTNEAQKKRWLPQACSGNMITAIAMSEPNAGSDLAGVQTTAVQTNSGDYILNGSKTFITNGILSDLIIVVAKTDANAGHQGVSLLVVERGMDGFERGRNLEKIGLKAQDTAELFFKDVHVPKENLLGDAGKGFYYLMSQLPQERLAIAVGSVAGAKAALALTIEYCHSRTAFGKAIGKFQHSRFKLAEMQTDVQIAEVFVDRCIKALNQQKLTAEEAAMAKWWTSELLKKVVDQCLQLHGGYGFMLEYPIARMYQDARVQTIYGGTTEIMKEIIGRSLGF